MMRYSRTLACLLFPLMALFMVGTTTNGALSGVVQSFGAFVTSVFWALLPLMVIPLKAAWVVISLILPFVAAGFAGVMAHDLHKTESDHTSVRDTICIGIATLSILAGLFASGYTLQFSASLIFCVLGYFSAKKSSKNPKTRTERYFPLEMFFLSGLVCWEIFYLGYLLVGTPKI